MIPMNTNPMRSS